MNPDMVDLSPLDSLWGRVFTVAPLVVVGTREEDGSGDLAPKHLAMPVGASGYFAFACTPRHRTWVNAVREGSFTVSYPKPDQVVLASLAASPRCEDDVKHTLEALPSTPAQRVPGVLLADAHLQLECDAVRVVEGLGEHGLVLGRIVAARAAAEALRGLDTDDQDLLERSPVLAYLTPGRFAEVAESRSFPLPDGMRR